MNDIEKYEFDRVGYLVIGNLLTPAEVASLSAAVDTLEAHALAHVDKPPRKVSPAYFMGEDYHFCPELGYHAQGSSDYGQTLMIEDFFNADPAFDFLIGHPRTMEYMRELVQGPIRINNSEIRIRYEGNHTGAHMGGPIDHKYRYAFNAQGIDAMMVRMVYFLHDVSIEQGAFCVVPATHKSNYKPWFQGSPDDEPHMVGLEVKAGNGILFTENLRHGGLTNHSKQVRKTLHVGYGPHWMSSQNIATMDEPLTVLPSLAERLTPAQRSLLIAAEVHKSPSASQTHHHP